MRSFNTQHNHKEEYEGVRDIYVRWMRNYMGSKIKTEAIKRDITRTWNETLGKLLATIGKTVR